MGKETDMTYAPVRFMVTNMTGSPLTAEYLRQNPLEVGDPFSLLFYLQDESGNFPFCLFKCVWNNLSNSFPFVEASAQYHIYCSCIYFMGLSCDLSLKLYQTEYQTWLDDKCTLVLHKIKF